MARNAQTYSRRGTARAGANTKRREAPRIHPVIMYPYTQPPNYADLTALYSSLVARLKSNPDVYAEPITVMNRQTFYNNARYRFNQDWNQEFVAFRDDCVAKYSRIIDAWCVDTCQMWLAGLGEAYDKKRTGEDVYWLIPGDFDYAGPAGKSVIDRIEQIPAAVRNNDQDLCVGEIDVELNSAKQLIDTYGTYGLLYNWFPHEAQEIRRITDKPRTEFFAIRNSFLREMLRQRWYGYEQTIVILLHGVIGKKRVSRIRLGKITDPHQGRDNLASAMQQVERTERVLKLFWRERHDRESDWPERFRVLDAQSEQIRAAALVILQNLLRSGTAA